MNKLKLICTIITASLILTLFIINNSKANTIEKHANLKTIYNTSDYGKIYNNKNIIDNSIVIVQAKTLTQNLINTGIMPFTHSTLKIEKVYKGNVKEGNKINVLEYGGIVNGEWFVKEQANKYNTKISKSDLEKTKKENFNFIFGKIPISEINSSNIFFLDKSADFKIQSGQLPVDSYGIVGGNQGRYEIVGGVIKRPIVNDLQRFEMSIDEFQSYILKQ